MVFPELLIVLLDDELLKTVHVELLCPLEGIEVLCRIKLCFLSMDPSILFSCREVDSCIRVLMELPSDAQM